MVNFYFMQTYKRNKILSETEISSRRVRRLFYKCVILKKLALYSLKSSTKRELLRPRNVELRMCYSYLN